MVVRYWGEKLPVIQSSFIALLKMLSIKVWLRLVNLVGKVMLGRRLVEYMISRKSETFLFESHFRRSILKSPSDRTSLFQLINYFERGFRYSSLNSLCCMHPTIMLLESFWIISIKTDSSFIFLIKSLSLIIL